MYNDNLARKLDTHSYNGNISVSTPRKLKAPQKKTRINVDRAVKLGIFLIVFVLGSLLVLGKNVKVTEQGKKVSKLKEEYSRIETENRKKELEISRKVDLATVEEAAIASCNMNRARQEQIVYINVQAEDYGVVYGQDEPEKTGFLRGLLAYLK